MAPVLLGAGGRVDHYTLAGAGWTDEDRAALGAGNDLQRVGLLGAEASPDPLGYLIACERARSTPTSRPAAPASPVNLRSIACSRARTASVVISPPSNGRTRRSAIIAREKSSASRGESSPTDCSSSTERSSPGSNVAARSVRRSSTRSSRYAGLRRGELMALRREDVDLAAGVIHVRRGWDAVEGEIATKSGKDRRVPIPAILRDHLDDQLQALAWTDGLVFGVTADRPFNDTTMREHTRKAWGWQLDDQGQLVPSGLRERPLEPITLHECRHTFASLMIAAGVNAKALSTYMGHAGIQITLDLYGHLMPGNESEAAAQLDAYLGRADGRAQVAQVAA
jgi:hypothetical protein